MTLFFGFLPNTGFVDEYPEEYILQTARVIAPQDAAQVVLNDITVTAMLKVQKTEVSTVGGSFLAPFTKTEQEKKKLLDGITTVFSPKHLCVIVGPPQCGKSTLLRLVAGQLDKNLERTGDMLYNGRKMPTQLLQRMASYTSQIDQHLPSLTVGETLDFSSECTNNRFTKRFAKTAAAEKVGLSAKQQMNNGHTPTTEFFLKKYHLDHVENSGIGDDMTRGVSGGEKKRVTVAEMKMSPAIIECADEITTGLDSSVTVEMMKLNKVQTKLMKKTLIVSLLQPPAAALAARTPARRRTTAACRCTSRRSGATPRPARRSSPSAAPPSSRRCSHSTICHLALGVQNREKTHNHSPQAQLCTSTATVWNP